jgi:raffinose/stachyose/melibiose transport system permease protein/N-acetylglucosamine transport system permease protein
MNKTMSRGRFEKTILWVVFAVFFIYAVSLVYPFVWMGVNAGKTKTEFFGDVISFPQSYQWGNFYDALFKNTITAGSGEATHTVNLFQMFGTSIYLTVLLTVLEVFMSACAAYVVCYYKFPGRRLIYGLVIFSMVVPLVGTLPASYQFMFDVKLLDTIWGMLFLCVNGLSFCFLMLYGSFKSLSWSYAEAASIDGAGNFRIFFHIMLPLMRPALTAMAVVIAIGFWNDYATPAIYYPSQPTLAVGINALIGDVQKGANELYKNNYPMMFACMLVAVIPIVVFFSCFQKTIMKNMVAGGLKG